jgi:hypothetical protein
MTTRIMTLVVCCLLSVAPFMAAAQDKSLGQTFGEVGRAIKNDSRSAYEDAKDAAVEAGHAMSEGAREAYEESKHIGPQMAEDIKKDFQSGGHAPDPTREAAPAPEKR